MPIPLDEETYVSALEYIIQRDFFPSIAPLEPLPSLLPPESGNLEPRTPVQIIPKTVETSEFTNIPLNAFLSKYNSTDNISFGKIIERMAIEHREKYYWIDSGKAYQRLIENLADKYPLLKTRLEKEGTLATLKESYVARNTLMFTPEEAPKERKKLMKHRVAPKSKEVRYSNTRFPAEFDPNPKFAPVLKKTYDYLDSPIVQPQQTAKKGFFQVEKPNAREELGRRLGNIAKNKIEERKLRSEATPRTVGTLGTLRTPSKRERLDALSPSAKKLAEMHFKRSQKKLKKLGNKSKAL